MVTDRTDANEDNATYNAWRSTFTKQDVRGLEEAIKYLDSSPSTRVRNKSRPLYKILRKICKEK